MSNNIEILTPEHKYLIELLIKELKYSLQNTKTLKEHKNYMNPNKFEILYRDTKDNLCCCSNLTMLYLARLLKNSLPIEIELLNTLNNILTLRFTGDREKTRMGFVNGIKINFEMTDNEISGDDAGNRFLNPNFVNNLLITLETIIYIIKNLKDLKEIDNSMSNNI